jgi:hypothetical protein
MTREPNYSDRLIFKRCGDVQLSRSEILRVQSLARQLDAKNRFSRERSYFKPYAQCGLGQGPMVIFGDVREIPLLANQGAALMDYRLSSFAQSGDVVVLGTTCDPEFLSYRTRKLPFGKPDYLEALPASGETALSAPKTCLGDDATYSRLLDRMRHNNCTTVLAHITTGTIWSLARRLGQDLGWQMQVAGPYPTLSRHANDKLWFSKVTKDLFGPDAVPIEFPVHGAAALTGAVRSLSRQHNKLVIKVPDSAGSRGNFVISCAELRDLGVKAIHRRLAELLAPVNANARFPLMLQVWQNQVLLSPSIQIWIPEPEDGPPIIEGLFQQRLTGPNGKFAGAAKVELPQRLDGEMTRQGMMLATLFQELGYFGRCSCDAVIAGEDLASASLHWIECNGRWGGVSIPLTLVNTLYRDTEVPEMLIFQAPGPADRRQGFAQGCKKLDDLLWTEERQAVVVFRTPSGFKEGENLHFVALAATMEQARHLSELTVKRLTDGH